MDQLGKVVTDNGSNIKKGFDIDLGILLATERFEEMNAETPNVFTGPPLMLDPNIEDEGYDEDKINRAYDRCIEQARNEDEENLAQLEYEMVTAFGYKRMSCFIHSLQLVVVKFSKIRTFDFLLRAAYKLVRKVHGRKPGEALKKVANKTLVRNMPVRWSSTLMLIDRLADVQDYLVPILNEHKIDNLSHTQWNLLREIRDLLLPFAEFTELLQSSKAVTLSGVIPALLVLESHLLERPDAGELRHTDIQDAADELLENLKSRFSYVCDPKSSSFDPTYVMATFLDPRYRSLLTDDQEKVAMSELKQFFPAEETGEIHCASSGCSTDITLSPTEDNPPSPKVARVTAGILSQLIQQKQIEAPPVHLPVPRSVALCHLDTYYQKRDHMAENQNVLEYWNTVGKEQFSEMVSIACQILCIPASTASAERLFSSAENCKSSDRSRLSPQILEREVLLRSNKDLAKEALNVD